MKNSIEELKSQLATEEDADIKALLQKQLDKAIKLANDKVKTVEIDMAIIAKVVASNPQSGWSPDIKRFADGWTPIAVQLLSAVSQSKQASKDLSDARIELLVNNVTVKTYQSSLLGLWQEVSKEPLWLQGSATNKGILNPKLKLGYDRVDRSEGAKCPFKMVVACK